MGMAQGWMLVLGIVLLLVTLGLGLIELRGHRGPARPRLELAGLGTGLVVMGIVFGEEAALGYALMAVGVAVSVAGALLGRVGARA